MRVANGEVMLPVTRSGSGQKLIFFNGICATQIIWKPVIARLAGRYEIVTFDFRSHGRATPSADHSFGAFLSDAEAVMTAVGSDRPIVVAWSFGADVAVAYAAAHPGELGGIVVIDGALPLADPLVQDESQLRRTLNSAAMRFSMLLMQMTPYRYSLSGDDIADITLTADAQRQGMIGLYDKVDCPIIMLLATQTAGANTVERSLRNNGLWRQAGARLAAQHPEIEMTWFDAGHRLPLTHPRELAAAIDAFAGKVAPGR
jgi:pimeloyl-ACP methyl ester carboxylesterase